MSSRSFGSTSPLACPCLHVKPCHERCTCVQSFSSVGCRRCCSYGSVEQQRMAAEMLVRQEKAMALLQRVMDAPSEHEAPWDEVDELLGRKKS